MNFKQKKLKKILSILLVFATLALSINAISLGSKGLVNGENQLSPKTAVDQQYGPIIWIIDGFSSQGTWHSSVEGDEGDVDAVVAGGTADLIVVGDERTFSLVVDPANGSEMAKWTAFKKNPNRLEPHDYGNLSSGFWVSHEWDENSGGQDENYPAMYWMRNITLPVNMSDYTITSAFMETNFSARVEGASQTGSTWIGGIDTPGDAVGGGGTPQNDSLDVATWVVDLYDQNPDHLERPVSRYESETLGADSDGEWSNITETPIPNIGTESDLISILTSVLREDYVHFSIIIGIELFCADNEPSTDVDNWEELLITSLNLTFTYEKNIDKDTTVAWNQEGALLSSTTDPWDNATFKSVDNVRLRFDYSIDTPWTSESTHSKLMIQLNGQDCDIYTHYVELIDITPGSHSVDYTLTDYGYINEVTDYVNLTVLLVMDNNFVLTENVTISIDNVRLDITYTLDFEEAPLGPEELDFEDFLWLVYILAGVLVGVGAYSILYMTYLKYPPMVRKIRALKRKVRKNRSLKKPVVVQKRATLERKALNEKMQVIKGATVTATTAATTAAAGKVATKTTPKSPPPPPDNKKVNGGS